MTSHRPAVLRESPWSAGQLGASGQLSPIASPPMGCRSEWWTSISRALENAVVMADSHGDDVQAHRTLTGAVARHPEAPVAERAAAWAYLAELRVRLDDATGAQQAIDEVRSLTLVTGLSPLDQEVVALAAHEVAVLPITPG